MQTGLLNNTCTGASTGLDHAQCDAFQTIFDGMGGTGWTECNHFRLDPCSCTYLEYYIRCKGADITEM